MIPLAILVLLFVAYEIYNGGSSSSLSDKGIPSMWTSPITPTPQEAQLANAIAAAELANPTYNNPGDLKVGDVGFGVFGEAPGITIFGSSTDGWNALYHQVHLMLTGTSHAYSISDDLYTVSMKWSNSDPNWAARFAQALSLADPLELASVSLSDVSQGAFA